MSLASTQRRAVLAASTGGHLAQMVRLLPHLPIDDDPLFITFDHPQSRSLLEGRRVKYVPYIAPRDYRGLAFAAPSIVKALRGEKFDVAISTGAAIASLVLPMSRSLRREAWYIESVSRFDGPSVTGKLVSKFPGVRTFTQHPAWMSDKWEYQFSVLEDYSAVSGPGRVADGRPKKVFVTLGTIKPYRFDRLVDKLLEVIPESFEIVWQLGDTVRDDLPGEVHITVPADDFRGYIEDADVVISHSGVGSAMQILDLGKCPVLVPRRRSHGEHVDDHQGQIARELAKRNLAVAAEVDDITLESILATSSVNISVSERDSTAAGFGASAAPMRRFAE